MTVLSLDARWAALEDESVPGDGAWLARLSIPCSCSVFVGLTYPDRRRMLRMEVDPQGIPHELRFRGTKGFTAGIDFDSARRLSVLTITATNESDIRIFSAFVESVLKGITGTLSPRQCVDVLLRRVELWRKFFSGEAETLGAEARAGLFGELHVLRELLGPTSGWSAAVAAWAGPEGAAQDFQFPELALEVKTTRGTPPGRVRIASTVQLETDHLVDLYLVVCYVDAHGSDGESLPDLIGLLREQLDAEWSVRERFETLLTAQNYCDAHAHLYGERYKVLNASVYHVEGEFPRLRPSSVPGGVEAVTYTLNMAACAAWKREMVELTGRLPKAGLFHV